MSLNPRKTVLLICDVQERFRSAIYGFEPLTASICKLVKASQVLGIPNFVTEQNPRALGPTVQEITSLLDKSPDQELNLGRFSKTKFSMITDESWEDDIGLPRYKNFILTGIESHICITQTALDALKITGAENIYIPVDAVSSCNKEEVPIALDNLRQRGVQITTSESLLYRLLGDADHPQFKYIAKLVKEEKQNTTEALQTLAAVL
ncbi:hypothetical protein L198_02981 [Cryptococcus wingfieldii CBS 7118]|uniref:Isochorismatase-like domain-containing protein n=1 Tax=Cryptococcus wingfieldii CBS 7118 TaxID=1295528 RepID=A0A1E3JII4_9TREE|nr:hypothetical protein L198_02981 [Cryptococcus wingfieldii CBS 7118]ODO00658.1 hypothetical protein L198_02981 [Cryptococcus wingfieldii CBS 7118]